LHVRNLIGERAMPAALLAALTLSSPGEGAKFLAGSSAYTRHSTAAPLMAAACRQAKAAAAAATAAAAARVIQLQ
jgi:hypothetical protein